MPHLNVAFGILASDCVTAVPINRCQRVELIPRVKYMRREHF